MRIIRRTFPGSRRRWPRMGGELRSRPARHAGLVRHGTGSLISIFGALLALASLAGGGELGLPTACEGRSGEADSSAGRPWRIVLIADEQRQPRLAPRSEGDEKDRNRNCRAG